jgi:hypothetical protein
MDIILQETGVVLICDERQTKDKESATSQTVATLQRLVSRVSIVDLQGKIELQDEYMNRFIADGAISEFVLGLFVDCKLVLNDAQLIEACKANNLTEVLKNQLSARQNERQ